jgi:hypothetical protein
VTRYRATSSCFGTFSTRRTTSSFPSLRVHRSPLARLSWLGSPFFPSIHTSHHGSDKFLSFYCSLHGPSLPLCLCPGAPDLRLRLAYQGRCRFAALMCHNTRRALLGMGMYPGPGPFLSLPFSGCVKCHDVVCRVSLCRIHIADLRILQPCFVACIAGICFVRPNAGMRQYLGHFN